MDRSLLYNSQPNLRDGIYRRNGDIAWKLHQQHYHRRRGRSSALRDDLRRRCCAERRPFYLLDDRHVFVLYFCWIYQYGKINEPTLMLVKALSWI